MIGTLILIAAIVCVILLLFIAALYTFKMGVIFALFVAIAVIMSIAWVSIFSCGLTMIILYSVNGPDYFIVDLIISILVGIAVFIRMMISVSGELFQGIAKIRNYFAS